MTPARLSPFGRFVAASVLVHGAVVVGALGGALHLGARPEPVRKASPEDPTLAGETFEVPTEDILEPAPAAGAAAPSDPAPAAEREESPAETVPETAPGGGHRRPRPRSAAPAAAPASAGAEGSEGAPARFGAVGDRSAAPLAAAFTRGFPQAASADPRWLSAPFGSAGSAEVDLVLDDAGTLIDVQTRGAPGAALAEALRRTLALIRARSFVAEGRVTRLRVSATVTPDEVHDGLHGEVFAIGGSFDGGEGSAFFALAVGRRIDVRVRVVK